MSVDLEATVPEPVRLDVLVAAAERLLAGLLALPSRPEVVVFGGRRYQQGRRVGEGRRLSRPELVAQVVGPHSPGRSDGAFEFEVLGGEIAWAWMSVMDDGEPGEPTYVLFSPSRTCGGVVLATALALAVAECAGGEFRDEEIGMLVPPETDPARVVEVTRLTDPAFDFGDACERYLRQFPQLGGWPSRA